MIYYEVKNVNNKNTENLIKVYENMLNFPGIKCPNCQKSDFKYYKGYERNVIENGKEYRIELKKVKCNHCNKRHVIVPDFLVPYKQYSRKTINKTIEKRVIGKETVNQIKKETGVSRQLQLIWKKQFMKIKSKVETTLTVFAIQEILKKIRKEHRFIKKYYQKNGEIYLMKKREILSIYIWS